MDIAVIVVIVFKKDLIMKLNKVFAGILAAGLVVSMAACGSSSGSSSNAGGIFGGGCKKDVPENIVSAVGTPDKGVDPVECAYEDSGKLLDGKLEVKFDNTPLYNADYEGFKALDKSGSMDGAEKYLSEDPADVDPHYLESNNQVYWVQKVSLKNLSDDTIDLGSDIDTIRAVPDGLDLPAGRAYSADLYYGDDDLNAGDSRTAYIAFYAWISEGDTDYPDVTWVIHDNYEKQSNGAYYVSKPEKVVYSSSTFKYVQ